MDIYSFFTARQNFADLPLALRQEAGQWISLIDLDLIEQALQSDEALFLQQILSAAEQDYFQRFRYIKRKKEWLGGRIAAKAALLALTGAVVDSSENVSSDRNPRSISILPDKHGRPGIEEFPINLFAQGSSRLKISLSHSDHFAVALSRAESSCGIDLQEISVKLAGLTDHFATDAELYLLAEQADCDEDTRLTMLWTVKEALKKAFLHDQAVIFSETELREINLISDSLRSFTCTVQGQRRTVSVHLLPPYILSMTEEDSRA